MTSNAAKLFDQAQSLSDRDRAELAARLIDSLDRNVDNDARAAWNEEIDRRIRELDDGSVTAVPWEEARRTIRDRIGNPGDD